MRHRKKGRLLHRKSGERTSLIRGLMRSLVLYKTIITTEARGKELRPHLEQLITKERRGTLPLHREVMAAIGKDAAKKIKEEILPALGDRRGGYLRIIKMGSRKSDASRMVQVRFIE
ncbi:MAG: 50S ribosomal protein L17 [Candidatus Ryanbacteria bacterium]|nr:50S ribosomal protein L17 [Candidatus Ryanbacteria bacterium]